MMETGGQKNRAALSPRHSIRTRLIGMISLMLVVILLVDLFIFSRINSMVRRIDSVFASNVSIGELSSTLRALDGYVYEYLSTKSTAALENYYRYAQEYRDLSEQLSGRRTDNAQLMLEKNIRGMSASYLEKAEEAIQAKRGRNVERYKAAYEEGRLLYGYINAYIYQLNTERFSQNSARYQYLLSVMNVMEVIAVLVIAALFVIILVGIILLVRSMVGPMTTLALAARQAAGGDLSVNVPVHDERDEIGVVSAAFNQMVASIREYIDRVREGMQEQARLKERELSMEANLKEAQLKFLQAQINPHFLFNSLNAGTQLAVMEDADATGAFLEKLADFFRYNVRKTDSDSTLQEEIALVDTYIYILNVRFAGDIHYTREVEEGIGQVRVPGMILQPLVENAVSHGIREMEGRGSIVLRAARDEGGIRVSVTDNGAGMTGRQIAEVFARSSGEIMPGKEEDGASRAEEQPGRAAALGAGEDSTGIGLENVIRRLALFYNRDGLLAIRSEGRGMGTEVMLLLPVTE